MQKFKKRDNVEARWWKEVNDKERKLSEIESKATLPITIIEHG